jgi:hypothetical protein
MRASTAPLLHLARIACAALALALVLFLALSVLPAGFGPAPAHAQEAGERRGGGGILRFLFPRNERQDRAAPPAANAPARAARPAQRRTVAPAPPPPPAIEKAEDAARILVIGDFLAGGLADGLGTAYGETPDVAVVVRSNRSSGHVPGDYYDWPGNITSIIAAEKPAAVVVMIGSNDRQQMRVGDAREQPRSDAWTAEYERRAAALVKAVRDRDLPLLWVGNLPFKSSAMSSDMIAFNDIYRRIVTDAGGEFIDVWDGFVDEAGNFVANGPDMNGQPAQLRADDGINVTRAGRRKIAFYVEKPLARLPGLGGAGIPASPDLEPGIQPGPGGVPAEIDRTPPLAIDDLGAEAGSGLLGASFARPEGESRARDGITPEPKPGRADDFMPRRPATETTGAVSP